MGSIERGLGTLREFIRDESSGGKKNKPEQQKIEHQDAQRDAQAKSEVSAPTQTHDAGIDEGSGDFENYQEVEVQLPSKEEMLANLNGLSVATDHHREKLFPKLAELGGQKLSAIEVALAINAAMSNYASKMPKPMLGQIRYMAPKLIDAMMPDPAAREEVKMLLPALYE